MCIWAPGSSNGRTLAQTEAVSGHAARNGRVRAVTGRVLVLAIILFALHGTAADTGAQQLFTRVHPAMATDFTLYLYASDKAAADREADRVFGIVDDVEQLLSNYRPQSELSRINREAGRHMITTDPETFRFLTQSMTWSARSDGAFDITVGRLMKEWGFFRHTGRVPTDADLAQVRALTGWQRVKLDSVTRRVRFSADGLELDPGGIGKGFAVDEAVAALRADGVRAALLSAGSSTLYGLGAPPGTRGWLVRIPDPLHGEASVATVRLRDMSLSTANCSEKHFVSGGHTYCHIMDPRTLRPVEGRLQATVIAPSATDSDALSNAVFVLDHGGRGRLMRSLPYADAALVVLPADRGEAQERWRWPNE